MRLLLLNLVLAFLWAGWTGEVALDTLVVGYLVGLGLLRLGLPIYREDGGYFRRVLGFIKFLRVFAREMWNSTTGTAKIVLFTPVADLHPNLITLDTRGLSSLEILLLTHTITLTPGTTSVDVARDKSWILVHALDGRHPGAVRESIEGSLKEAILGFTR